MSDDGEVSSPNPFDLHPEEDKDDTIAAGDEAFFRGEAQGEEEEDDGRVGEGVSASLLEPRVPLQLGPTAGPSPPPHSEVPCFFFLFFFYSHVSREFSRNNLQSCSFFFQSRYF